MKFVVDAQLPPALARRLEELGHEAVHVIDLALEAAPDDVIWAYAIRAGAVLISKDQDFALMQTWLPAGPPLVWIRIGNTTRRALLTKFELAFPSIVLALQNGERLVELTD